MPTGNGLKRFVNGGAPALIKHFFALLGLIVAAVVAGTLLYAEVKATGKKANNNQAQIEVIKTKFNEVTTQQRLLSQKTDSEIKLNKEFRTETGRALNEILLRLPRLNGGRIR